MLSIVKMEIDADMDLLEERPNKSDEIDITEEPIRAQYYRNASSNMFDKLEMIPIVYTTRLEDMPALQYTSFPIRADPRDVSTRILKQSKPILHMLPVKKRRRYKKRFREMKAYLENIYTHMNIEHNPAPFVTEKSRKIKEEPPDESKVLNDSSSENTKPKNTCKYSDLLKLCKPCSVVLPGIDSHTSNAVIHGGQVLQVNKVHKPILSTLLREPSSDEEQPLITLCPELLLTRNTIEENVSKRLPVNNSSSIKKKITEAAHIAPRLMRNSVLELVDGFSKEYSMYYMDNESHLLDYFKDTTDKAYLHENKHNRCSRHVLNNCCWVKRDETLQSLYPKVLIYPNSRFMRKPHPCKPGACVCCCRKKENIEKPNLVKTEHPSASSNLNTLDKEDTEIQDLEDKIQKNIINTNKTPKLNSSEWLRRLLTPIKTRNQTQKKLIERALNYTKRHPKEPKNQNRRLVTLKKGDLQNSVLILRNFAMDVTEIYEINLDSNIETSIITTCYNNTNRPDIKKLLKNPNAVNETVCCWFKREAVITKLQNTKNLLSSAAKMFIRTSHACPTNKCTCCCKPKSIYNIALKDIKLPSRTNWSTTLSPLKSSQDFQPQLVSSFSLATESELTKFQVEPPPLVPLPAQSSTFRDDDCQITSVIASPSLRPIPQNPTVPTLPTEPKVTTVTVPAGPTNIMITDVVDSEEMSQEVNSLISSILDRFKDVRLTINSDGKVAAALNTPVNTLSTVELKVLANILSFAQSQVNLLGAKSNVNSGMSLSNIINLKVDDVQNSTLDPKVVYKEFGKNDNVDTNGQSPPQSNDGNNIPLTFPYIAPQPTPLQTYTFFTDSTSFRNQQLKEAFTSFIATKIHPKPPSKTATPVIESVFSLNKEPEETESASTTMWYSQTTTQQQPLSKKSIKTYSNNSQKRKDDEPSFTNPKKIKVISPSKLGVTESDVSENTAIAHNLIQQTVSVGGFLPVVPLLSNNNVQIITSPRTEPSFNAMPSTASQPILIINPLNTPNLMNSGSTVSVPFTNNSLIVQNVMSIAHPQSKIPLPVNTDKSQVETDSTNVPVAQPTTSGTAETELAETVDAEEYVNNELDEQNDNSESTHTADLDTKLEYSEEETEEENYENNWPGMENCDEEEDCILGF